MAGAFIPKAAKAAELQTEYAPIVQVRDLVKVFEQRHKTADKQGFHAVSGVSFDICEGEILGLLGESGCGKTTLARMIAHLIRPTSGTIQFNGVEIQTMSERHFRPMRRAIQMVYQNPFDCLNPRMRISRLLEEPLKLWRSELNQQQRIECIKDMLSECGLDDECLTKHSGEFSGGQLQRISIARALLARPKLLIADEIVSALDVPVQNQILQLLVRMKEGHGFSVLFITHDLSVARNFSDRLMVMQSGKIIGEGMPDDLLGNSINPNIRALADAVFTFDGAVH